MGLRVDKKSGMLLVVLSLVLTYLTLYTANAYTGMLEILSEMNGVDKFIYLYLIKSWALVGVTILLWIVMVLYVLRLANRLYRSPT